MMKPSRFAGQRSQPACFHRQGLALRFLGKIILARGSGIFPENLACGGGPAKHMKIMKTKERIRKIADSRWARTLALAVTAAIIFSWLYSHGISPVWTAVAIICFRGLFRFLYRIACFLVALAIILCILSFLVF